MIREAQMRVLQEAMWTSLILDHIHECFPEQCEDMGEQAADDLAKRAMKKGRAYGFTQLSDLQQYADLVILLGENFESTEEYAWTREILEDRNPASADFRATWLTDQVVEQLARKPEPVRKEELVRQ